LSIIKVRDLYISGDYILPIEYLYTEKDIKSSAEKTNEIMGFAEACGKKQPLLLFLTKPMFIQVPTFFS